MMLTRFFRTEKLLALIALAGALSGAIWWRSERSMLRRLRAERVAADFSGGAYVPATWPEPLAPASPWRRPSAQSAGDVWLYELFTPPTIYYHAATRTFTATPPVYAVERANLPFGLELLAVKREPFRLQLVGYVGAPGDYVAAFVSAQTPETLLGRAGKRFDQLGLALKSFEVRRANLAASAAAQPAHDLAAIAIVRDDRSGADVTLDTHGPTLTDTPLAVLRVVASVKSKPRVLREGDAVQDGETTFRVERIRLDPPEVVVAKHTAGLPFPELRLLKPETAEQPTRTATAAARRFDSAAAKPGVATSAARP